MKKRSDFNTPKQQQYNISYYQTINLSKDEDESILKKLQLDDNIQWKKINVATLVKKGKIVDFIKNNMLCVGYKPKEKFLSKIVINEELRSDFVFLDYDNKDGKQITYDKAKEILDASGYNYVLVTSKSHSSVKHKLHILLPTLRALESNEEHRENTNKISQEFNSAY